MYEFFFMYECVAWQCVYLILNFVGACQSACTLCIDRHISFPATKTRLERELAEAVQEEDETSPESAKARANGGDADLGSDSDSDFGEGPYPFALQQPSKEIVNSLEASLWSLDLSATSSMETSGYTDTEVDL